MNRIRIVSIVSLALATALVSCATPHNASAPPAQAPAPSPAVTAPTPPPTAKMHINEAGLAIIKESEGHNLKPYQDGGHWFVGYGHAVDGPGPAIREAEAEVFLRQDLAVCEGKTGDAVTQTVSANEFSAMVSLCYNLGWQNFVASSVVAKLNTGDRAGAADAFLLFTKATIDGARQELPRLRARREKERALFLKPETPPAAS